jgi:SAM-dependent methyltransferase
MNAESNQKRGEVLDTQCEHWKKVWREQEFSMEPSYAARVAIERFCKAGVTSVLELGCGPGRDSLAFLQAGMAVVATDCAEAALEKLEKNAEALGVRERLETHCHDIREPLPFADDSVEVCYSHMLYCMALSDDELQFLNREILRVLKPGGVNVYSVRNTQDPACGTGKALGGTFYELDGGFVVRFFDQGWIDRLTDGYELIGQEEFDEGAMPKRLSLVTMLKGE